jgi:hypothetical protein
MSFRMKNVLANKAPPRGLVRLFRQRDVMAANDEDDNQSTGGPKYKPGCLGIVSRNEPPSGSTNFSLRPTSSTSKSSHTHERRPGVYRK